MRITDRGQVTIPHAVRSQPGLVPHGEVELGVAEDHALTRKANPDPGYGERVRRALDALRGTAQAGMSTDEIMASTRGETEGFDGSRYPVNFTYGPS